MDELYGRVGSANNNRAVLSQENSKYARTTNLGRLTPLEAQATSRDKAVQPRLSHSSLGGRVTPCDTSFRGTNKQANGGILNASSHNSSKLSSSNSGANSSQTKTTMDLSNHELNSTQISPIAANRRNLIDTSHSSQQNGGTHLNQTSRRKLANNMSNVMLLTAEKGVKELLQSLGLLSVVSLVLALVTLVLLVKISPPPDRQQDSFLTISEYETVHQVTLSMCCLSLSLNLSCLLVCTVQFLFAAKLSKANQGRIRSTKYLKKAAITRVCAMAGFFISIPLFLIGVVLFSFLHFSSTPAIVISIIIGLAIVFCGAAVVHNVFLWQREKTKHRKDNGVLNAKSLESFKQPSSVPGMAHLSHISLPHATLDLSNGINRSLSARALELSTLV